MPDGVENHPPLEITRATMRLRIEPWRIADDTDAHKTVKKGKRLCGGKEGGCKACQLTDVLYKTQRHVAGAMNLIARHHERRDGLVYEEQKLLGETKIKLPPLKRDGYNVARSAYPEVQSGIVAAAAQAAEIKWRDERFSILVRNERSAARYTADNAPIPLRSADVSFSETETRDVFLLRFSLLAGRATGGKQFSLPIRVRDQRQYKVLHEIARGNWKKGALQIQRDKRGKWHLRMAYKRTVELATGETRWAAINRGIVCFLAVVTEEGERLLYDGHDIEAYLNQMQNRRQKYQRSYPVSGRKGHGRKRALRPTEYLSGVAADWRKTRIQVIAREVSRWLVKQGVTHLVIEDFKGIRDGVVEKLEGGKPVWDRIQTWPYYEMGQRLQACCEEEGIVCVEMSAAWTARTCPECGDRQEQKVVSRMFTCQVEGCGFKRHVDVVTAWNLCMRAREKHGDGQELIAELLKKQEAARKKKERKKK